MIKKLSLKSLLILTSVLLLIVYNICLNYKNEYKLSTNKFKEQLLYKSLKLGEPSSDTIVIAVTCCGDQSIIDQTFVMLKSVVLFTKQKLHFIVFVDKNPKDFAFQLMKWPENILDQITFEIMAAHFPNVKNPDYYKNVFKLCASQRLFYPLILKNYDSVIHIDSDVILLSDVRQLWAYFRQMDSKQMIGMATDNMNPKTSGYKHRNTGALEIPVPTEYSLNTGVILMNLSRLREIKFFDDLEPIVKQYRQRLKWFVNDFMSIYLSEHKDRYFQLPCHWNYVTDHCTSGQLCYSADTDGVALLHGSRQTFISSANEPAFRAVYLAFIDYQFNSDLVNELLIPLKRYLMFTAKTECGKLQSIYYSSVEKYVKNSSQ